MSKVIYTLDSAIESFFSEGGASSSRKQCDDFVRQRYGAEVTIRPVDIQGAFSYTVIAGPNIIQFREKGASLDTSLMALAKEIHGDVVPSCSELGSIGDPKGSQLTIYEMEMLSGDNYITARGTFTPEQRVNTVQSLASFFAQSWQGGHQTEASAKGFDTSAISTEYTATLLGSLADGLPERFLPAITEVQATLPALFSGSYPVVLTHGDFNEMNILVDHDSGKITGVVDWNDSNFQPFGFALYALDNTLGWMGRDGWTWFDDADDLREKFWETFRQQTGLSDGSQVELSKVARKAGILIRYGTVYDSGAPGMRRVRDPKVDTFRYLDALL